MVVDSKSDTRADRCLAALADSTRRDIFKHVLQREESVSSLARRYPMSFAAVQKHVAVLERAGLVTKRKHGREQLVCGRIEEAKRLNKLFNQFEQLWLERIDRMDEILKGKKRGSK